MLLSHIGDVFHAHVSERPTVAFVEDLYECVPAGGFRYEIAGPCPRCFEVISGTCEPQEFERKRFKRHPKNDAVVQTRMWCGCGHHHLWAEGHPADEPGCGNEFKLPVLYPPADPDGKVRLAL